jgi:hypothetical protein
MSRRIAGTAVALASLLAGMPAAHAATELPRAGCSHRVTDEPNDAPINYNTLSSTGSPAVSLSASSVAALDITSVTPRLTADSFQVFVALTDVVAPGAMPATSSEYRYKVTLTANAKTVSFGAAVANPANASIPKHSEQNPYARTGSIETIAGLVVDVNADTNFVTFTVPRQELEKNLGVALVEGQDDLTDIKAVTQEVESEKVNAADTTTATGAAATWTAGDDYCFGPPPAALSDYGADVVQYGDTGFLHATLKSEAGTALAGKLVQFAVAGKAVTATTDANGLARAAYTPVVGAGTYKVAVTFAGDAENGKAALSGDTVVVVVKAEAAKVGALQVAKPSATARSVTATLTDDDKHAIAGQKVDWYADGKKVATLTTDSAGRSIYKSAKRGQTVQAKFAGVAGKYLAAASTALRLS